MSHEEKPEGWYTDPFGRHEARWMSEGRPTRLVRDGDTTSDDEPPEGPFVNRPEPIESPPSHEGAGDLRRADDAERGSGAPDTDAYMRQMDAVWSDGAPDVTRYERQN